MAYDLTHDVPKQIVKRWTAKRKSAVLIDINRRRAD